MTLLFKSRRQMIRRALPHLNEEHFASVGLSGTQRAEELRIEDFVRLANETPWQAEQAGPGPETGAETAGPDQESGAQ